jgi:Tfp pilus assembly protein PilW
VDLLVVLVISSFIISAGFAIYIRSHQTYLAQTEVSDAQYRVRDALREISDDIRMAGYLIPTSLSPFVTRNTDPDTVMIYRQPVNSCQVNLTAVMASPTANIVCGGGQTLTCFKNGQMAYIYDVVTKTGEFFTISTVDNGNGWVQHTGSPLTKSYPANSQVMTIDYNKFYIDNTTDVNHPRLMVSRNGAAAVLYAVDIQDLQLVYTLADGSTTSSPANSKLIRKVQITLQGKTQKSDVDWNRLYRQRSFATNVKVRNLDLQ